MKTNRTNIPSRSEAWKAAAWYALLISAAILIVVKIFTGIVFATALIVAVIAFAFSFGMIMRITPRVHD